MAKARLGDGEISYEVYGDGHPLLLIMGLAGRGADWPPEFIEAMGPGYQCVTYDHRGCGASDPASGEVTMRSMAADAAALLDHLGIESAYVAGISMGGMIAQRLALDFPGHLGKLALIATHCGGPSALGPRAEVLPYLADPKPGRKAATEMTCALSAPGLAERRGEMLEAFMDRFMEAPTRYRVMRGQMDAIAADDRRDALNELSVPALVITGADDLLVPPENSTLLHERIPGATLHVISDCGHMVMLEQHEALAEALRGFLT